MLTRVGWGSGKIAEIQGQQAMLLRHCPEVQSRDEHWTGLGLNWIRSMTVFVTFGLDPGGNCFINLGSRPD